MSQIEKAFKILEVLIKRREALSVGELSQLSGVSIASTYRICLELANIDYLKKEKNEEGYFLGVKFLQFNAAIQHSLNIANISIPHLEKLSGECREYSDLAILDNYEAVIVAQLDVPRGLKIANNLGARLPLNAASSGKVFLAYISKEDRQTFYKKAKLNSFTENTLTDINQLEQEVEKIRQNGYAIDNEEYAKGIWSVAAPVFDMKNVIAGLSLIVPTVRVNDENKNDFISAVKHTALSISKEFGGINF